MTPWGIKFIARNRQGVEDNVLEVGSRIIRPGDDTKTIRGLFPNATRYVGTDVESGLSVDRVVSAYELTKLFPLASFDCVVSGDAIEHIEDWKRSLEQMWAVLKTKGLLLLTTVSRGKRRHNYPDDFHRWDLADFEKIFREQEIVALGRLNYFVGAAVIKKRDKLKLENVEVYRLPEGD